MNNFQYDHVTDNVLFAHKKSRNYTNVFQRHDCYELYLFLKGNVNFYFEHYCHKLERGNLIIIKPDEFHRALSLDSSIYERIYIYLEIPNLQKLSTTQSDLSSCFKKQSTYQNQIILLNEQAINKFVLLFHEMVNAHNSEKFGSDILSNAFLSQLLVMTNKTFQQTYKTTDKNQNIMPALLSDTMQFIENNLTEDVSLQALSDHLHLNGTYVSRKFKEYTGITLQKYIISKKIVLAKKYLAEGKNVTETCHLSGFGDYANFIRTFKKQTGITPGKYHK